MSKAKGAIGEQGDVDVSVYLREPYFEDPIEQVISVLVGSDARQPPLPRYTHKFAYPPRRFIRDSDPANLPRLHNFSEGCQLFFYWNSRALLCRVIHDLPEERSVAIRPMYLIQIDIVGLQPLEASVYGLLNVLAVDSGWTAPHPSEAPARCGNLGGDNQLVALLLSQPSTKNGLGSALGLRAPRDR